MQKAEFYIYIYILIRFGKKEQSDHFSVMVEKKQRWNLKYQIQDPIILHVYELNITNVQSLKLLTKGSTLTTFSGNICDALRDWVPFVQFKKREKRPWRSVTFSKVD